MSFLHVDPRYAPLLHGLGLDDPDAFLRLRGVVLSGHPDRNVSRLTLGSGPAAVTAYLKREHRVPWRDRIGGWLAGIGFASKSGREMYIVQRLRGADLGISVPEVVAVGESSGGAAFLLVRELPAMRDLARHLRQRPDRTSAERRTLARQFGSAIARLHAAGVCHRDLYAKHVLLPDSGDTIAIVDWQRARLRQSIGNADRCRDLATLHATLPEDLASPTDRWVFLRAYCSLAGREGKTRRLATRRLATAVEAAARKLLRRRRIREQRRAPAPDAQNLVWLDGERYCVTCEFQTATAQTGADWLPRLVEDETDAPLTQSTLTVPGLGRATLIRRREYRVVKTLLGWLTGRPPVSPEFHQAAHYFRLQRAGVATPRVWAVGERRQGLGRISSFLLLEGPVGLEASDKHGQEDTP